MKTITNRNNTARQSGAGPIHIGMVSLGCSKNQVDAERILAMLDLEGCVISPDPADCDAVIVNTCGFIEDAKRESIETILEFAARKGEGRLKVLVVTGCLAERYREELAEEMPEVDVVLGIGCNAGIGPAIRNALMGKRTVSFGAKEDLSLEGERMLANPGYYAYLKVAEGCSNHCTYCAIPLIRGEFRSRNIEDVVAEARTLAQRGVRELNVVAQDTTRYGEDLYGKLMLPELLRRLCEIEELRWVRILYCYPDRITDELLDAMAANDKIVKYMDIPVQHASGAILKEMNRRGDAGSLTGLMQKIRDRLPGVALRTTMICGFPGEDDAAFTELCEFVEEVEFDRLGCFAYSCEEDTPAAGMDNQVDEALKHHRADIVMELQMGIAQKKARAMKGKTLEVLCEGVDPESGVLYGRSYMDAPDIDTRVYFTSDEDVGAGEFVQVEITGAEGYDLTGRRTE